MHALTDFEQRRRRAGGRSSVSPSANEQHSTSMTPPIIVVSLALGLTTGAMVASGHGVIEEEAFIAERIMVDEWVPIR